MSATVLPSEEDLLLTRSEAVALLESHRRCVKRVVRCCDDGAVLFIGAFDRPWTAWITRSPEGVAVEYEEGWSPSRGSVSRVSKVELVQTGPHPEEPRS